MGERGEGRREKGVGSGERGEGRINNQFLITEFSMNYEL
ncbi:hypothetical protein MYAER_0131 [Microcystis aeruginosa NIES-2549]|uniref:Uncharacterized protein n=1 Tax=Microcystis aeruginosa NIES-2549 TaxID=1641812 RepID=A0A0F6RJ02_MICAE|nr:hypothetical protein MYAER_0131 [Microcystis aeruginosa NIES-2549]